jgi:hypothetical protein
MNLRESWHKLDDDIRDRFQGEYGQAAFREVVTVLFMVSAHKMLKARINPKHHAALDIEWYASLIPNHPLHGLRATVPDTVADWAVEADDYFGGHLQEKFSWFDRQVPRLERYIDGLLTPAARR